METAAPINYISHIITSRLRLQRQRFRRGDQEDKVMKICPKCQSQLDDNAAFCSNCGAQFAAPQAQYATIYDPYDHTSEFDQKDISDNKVISMLVYLMGWIGIVIALLGSHSSPYVSFHVRQALKFCVVEMLMAICVALLFWTFIVPIAFAIMEIVLFVIKIICFLQICSGKAKEPAIIRSLKFLK